MNFRFSGLVSSEIYARQICNLLENLNPKPLGCGFTELDKDKNIWEVDAYFNYKIDLSVKLLLEEIFSIKFYLHEIKYTDWVAKVERKLTPITLQNIFIHGAHHKKDLSLNKKNVEIQAAMAFGTGHHSTTKSCVNIYLNLIKKGYVFNNILDVGCGTGVLSIVASKISKARITSIDNDITAVETTKHNFLKNHVIPKSKVFKSDGFNNFHLKKFSKFDLIFANILFLPLKKMVKSANKYLFKNGLLILSGISIKQSIRIEKIYVGHNFKKIASLTDENWMTLVMKKF